MSWHRFVIQFDFCLLKWSMFFGLLCYRIHYPFIDLNLVFFGVLPFLTFGPSLLEYGTTLCQPPIWRLLVQHRKNCRFVLEMFQSTDKYRIQKVHQFQIFQFLGSYRPLFCMKILSGCRYLSVDDRQCMKGSPFVAFSYMSLVQSYSTCVALFEQWHFFGYTHTFLLCFHLIGN